MTGTAGRIAKTSAGAAGRPIGSEKVTTTTGSIGACGPVGRYAVTTGGVESISNRPLSSHVVAPPPLAVRFTTTSRASIVGTVHMNWAFCEDNAETFTVIEPIEPDSVPLAYR